MSPSGLKQGKGLDTQSRGYSAEDAPYLFVTHGSFRLDMVTEDRNLIQLQACSIDLLPGCSL